MRRDDLYLNDIIEAADHIVAFLGQIDFNDFQKSERIRSAVVQKLGSYLNNGCAGHHALQHIKLIVNSAGDSDIGGNMPVQYRSPV